MNGARRYGPEKLKLTLFTIGKKYGITFIIHASCQQA